MNHLDEKREAGQSVVVLISAGTEWRAVAAMFAGVEKHSSPPGEWFESTLPASDRSVIFFHGGVGKVAAAASTQYVIDRFSPGLIVNLGTCGGFAGEVELGTILIAKRTVIYDIVEKMGDPSAAIERFATDLDLSWVSDPPPSTVLPAVLASADRDLDAADIPRLRRDYGAVTADWESGAIAYVASRYNIRCLILRVVSDLVGDAGGEADNKHRLWADRVAKLMDKLIRVLPAWVNHAGKIPPA
jgi:adenosylhomocysteine nucleosidase